LHSGDKVVSTNGQHKLIMQSDGNLVLYANVSQVLWNTGTAGNPGAYFAVQTDGNLAVYSASGAVLWSIYKWGTSNNMLQLQSDGNLAFRANNLATVIWATMTGSSSIAAGQYLEPGWFIRANGYWLVMQGDGNLVLYSATNQPIWHTSTGGHPGAHAILQSDGNFVIYQGSTALWNSQTQNGSPGKVQVNPYGSVSLLTSAGSPYWTVGQSTSTPLTFMVPASGQVRAKYDPFDGYCKPDPDPATHHWGWDISGDSTNVYAAEAGRVSKIGWDTTGYGYIIEVDHGYGFTTWYAHLDDTKIYVSIGDQIPKGWLMAMSGATGKVTGTHLHFELRIGGQPQDTWNNYFTCWSWVTAGAALP
jgi:hypothetical protein